MKNDYFSHFGHKVTPLECRSDNIPWREIDSEEGVEVALVVLSLIDQRLEEKEDISKLDDD